jgi:hypothetical protein
MGDILGNILSKTTYASSILYNNDEDSNDYLRGMGEYFINFAVFF